MDSSSSPPCFLPPTSVVSRTTCDAASVSPRRRTNFVCVLDERKNVTPTTRPNAKTVSKKPPSYVTSSKTATPTNYRILPDEERGTVPPPPVHYTVPMVGFFLDKLFNKRYEHKERYGNVFTSNGFFKRMHFVNDYNAIREMMIDWRTFSSVESSAVVASVFGKKSMTQLDGQEHTQLRSSFSPAFSPKLFPAYFELIQRRASQKWAYLADQSALGKKIYLDTSFRDLYLAITIEMTTGLTSDDEYYSKIRKLNTRLLLAFVSPPYGPLFDDAMKAKKELVEIVSGVVQRVAIENASIVDKLRSYGDRLFTLGGKHLRDTQANILCMLLAANEDIVTGVENDPKVFATLAGQIVGLWFAGYATSAATSSSSAFEMLRNPEILAKLQAEQDAIIADAEGVRPVQYSQLTKMSLLDAFINEILRVHPIAEGTVRKCTRDVEVFGRRLEKGSYVFFDWGVAMQDDAYYHDAKEFKWDRFVKQQGKANPPKVLTFSPPGTPHYCLGAQFSFLLMKTTFAEMLRGYDMKLDPTASTEYAIVPENVPASKVALSDIRPRF